MDKCQIRQSSISFIHYIGNKSSIDLIKEQLGELFICEKNTKIYFYSCQFDKIRDYQHCLNNNDYLLRISNMVTEMYDEYLPIENKLFNILFEKQLIPKKDGTI